MDRHMDRAGVTLTELLIVIAIIGILAAIAVPSYVGQQKRAARTEAYANLEALRLLQEQYYAENGEYADKNAASSGNIDGLTNIQGILKAFKPGSEGNLSYAYRINYTVVDNTTKLFNAVATGKTKTKVTGDTFWINETNEKNF